ncbi:MAG: hypothetical protein GF350_14390 [Chitinivibrionales bacterium]|nr:hypothetical protein [Chitinivibrionales bacterium]
MSNVQALLNARSGVWKALEMMNDTIGLDTLPGVDANDSTFGQDMFELTEEEFAAVNGQLVPNGGPVEIELFESDSFGSCEVSLQSSGIARELISVGDFRDQLQKVWGVLGGRLFSSPDTTLYLEFATEPTGGNFGGEFKSIANTGSLEANRFARAVRKNELSQVISHYQQELMSDDTLIRDMPRTVHYNDELGEIPDVVNGPLFIDGQMSDIVWRERRRVAVLGDLQFTGTSLIENVEFIVSNETKLFDQAEFRNVAIFSQEKVTIGNDVKFNGNIISLGNVLVYNDARIEDNSIVVCKSKGAKNKKNVIYSVDFSERAFFDGTLISLGSQYSLKTGPDVMVQGLIWAEGYVCHQGVFRGVMKARSLADCMAEQPVTPAASSGGAQGTKTRPGARPAIPPPPNVLLGTIEPAMNVSEYYFPFFIGDLCIMRWEESMGADDPGGEYEYEQEKRRLR